MFMLQIEQDFIAMHKYLTNTYLYVVSINTAVYISSSIVWYVFPCSMTTHDRQQHCPFT